MRRAAVLIPVLVLAATARAELPAPRVVDNYGDALPPGAVQRLGRVRPMPGWRNFEFTADGRSLAILTWGKYLSVFDLNTGKLKETLTLPTDPVSECRLFPDLSRALLVRRPNGPRAAPEWEVWDFDRGERIITIRPGGGPDHFYLISPDSRFVATAQISEAGASRLETIRVRLWDARSGRELRSDTVEFPPWRKSGSLSYPVFSSGGDKFLIAVGRDEQSHVYCWNVPRLDLRWERAVSGAGREVAVASADHVLLSGPVPLALNLAEGKDAGVSLPPDVMRHSTEAAWSDRGSYLYVSDEDPPRLKGWDWKQGRPAPRFKPFPLNLYDWPHLSPSPDQRQVLIAGKECQLLDLTTGRPVWADDVGAGHTKEVTGLVFSADGRRLASAGDDRTVQLWDVATGRPLGHWPVDWAFSYVEWTQVNSRTFGSSGSPAFDLSSDGRRLVFAEARRPEQRPSLRVVDVDSGKDVARTSMPDAGPAGANPPKFGRVGFSRTADSVFAVFGEEVMGDPSPRNTLARWDFVPGAWVSLGQVEQSPPARSAMSRDGRRLLTGGGGYGLATGRRALELERAGPGPMVLTPDGKLAAGITGPREEPAPGMRLPNIDGICFWDARTGQSVGRVPWTPPPKRGGWWVGFRALPASELRWAWPRQMAFHPAGRCLATADIYGVRLWDLVSGRVLSTVPLPMQPPPGAHFGSPATALAFTPDGTHLVTGLPDGTILFWPVPKPEPVPPRADELDGLWTDLIGSDAAKGWRAAWRLEDDPAAAVRLVRERLKPAEPVPADDVRRWLADVDAADFRRREAATKKLEAAIDRIVPAVTEALKASGTSPEARERLKKVLAAAPDDDRPLPAWAAGLSRAVAVLEHSDTAEGRAALRDLAAGAAGAWLTRESRAALDRLELRTRTGAK